MIAELKNLNSYIDEFGIELQRTHLAYINNLELAKQRAKEIIEDIIENGLEETTILRFPKLQEVKKIKYIELCKKFSMITLDYHSALCGGELRWILYE